MKNAYVQLNINLKDDLDTMKEKLKERLTKNSQEELEMLLREKSEREQKEIILNNLIFATYTVLKQKALKERDGAEQDYEKAYEKICTEEKRRAYEEELAAQADRYDGLMKDKKFWKNDVTNAVSSWEELQQGGNFTKEKMDPQNEFSEFSGAPYQWQVLAKQEVQKVVLDEMNEKNERMIITYLGKFQYSQLLDGPTAEKPMGQYAEEMKEADMIGILKLNLEGEVIRNDVMVTKLPEITEENKEFAKNEMFTDERMDNATKNNIGFAGEMIKSANAEQGYRIHYNGKQNRDLVTALTWANNTLGTIYLDNQGYDMTFLNMKKGLTKGYQNYVLKAIGQTNETPKGEERERDDE